MSPVVKKYTVRTWYLVPKHNPVAISQRLVHALPLRTSREQHTSIFIFDTVRFTGMYQWVHTSTSLGAWGTFESLGPKIRVTAVSATSAPAHDPVTFKLLTATAVMGDVISLLQKLRAGQKQDTVLQAVHGRSKTFFEFKYRCR